MNFPSKADVRPEMSHQSEAAMQDSIVRSYWLCRYQKDFDIKKENQKTELASGWFWDLSRPLRDDYYFLCSLWTHNLYFWLSTFVRKLKIRTSGFATIPWEHMAQSTICISRWELSLWLLHALLFTSHIPDLNYSSLTPCGLQCTNLCMATLGKSDLAKCIQILNCSV